MTREEAIETLVNLPRASFAKYSAPPFYEAIDMAVSALREQDVTDTTVGNKSDPCPWCKRGWDWDVIDGDFGQYVHHSMIKHCFRCGRRLEEV